MLALKRHMLLGLWPELNRPEPQPCECGGWLWPIGDSLWYCGNCGRLLPPAEPAPTPLALPLPLPLDGQRQRLWYPGPRKYVDRFGNEVLRREA